MAALSRPTYLTAGLALLAALAVLTAWAMRPAGSGAAEGPFIYHNVEYKVFGTNGALKSQGSFHNAVTENLLNDAVDGLTGGTAVNYDQVALCENNPNNAMAGGATPGTCDLVPTGDLAGGNPVTASQTVDDNSWELVAAFNATASMTIQELQLLKGAATSAGNIGAVRNTNITLEADDSLTITWTVTVNP